MPKDINYTKERILFVDDEPNILESYRRSFRSTFAVSTALGGKVALELLDSSPPFTVVVSDIKMPVMDGIKFLSRVRELYPDTVRMVLTGYADLNIAMSAVNQGDIFRFLTKPCHPDDLIKAIISGINQFKMIQSSRELAVVRRMKDALEGTLRAFTRLVEFRDPYTAGHMGRTAEISALIATRLGLNPDVIQGLHLAALVHDIGKITVPSGVLNKPEKLSKAEFAIIKTHSLVGAEIFATLETDWPIQRIVLEHHERIDGSGYPNGLKENEILLESKIIAVADSIDAILTTRPYRQASGKKDCIRLLEEDKGIKLDSDCVEAGIALLKEGLIFKDLPF
ncbi:HD domain-containing phosphohydrolase [Maridesulfovibrio ferrireducens]|uniref:HD domain-containing phosphohydrolase n=1 Tax=Maridesulfovibrio ferrireducens TaxID=246191 RepID=UPI001A311CC3|nr:HD domain-containing phosphohydrolase [Maridesulfovibrio ferrireducens]MBI9111911.1 response regulator [Maridesulfovibrio ferrireducens]